MVGRIVDGRAVLLLAAGMIACKPELPPLEYRSERARVGSDIVDQVCEGTLARIDRELGRVEARLEVSRTGEVVDLYIVDPATVDAYCGGPWGGCVEYSRNDLYIAGFTFDWGIAHELTHFRVGIERDRRSTPFLFSEGVAAALEPSRCPRKHSSSLTATKILGADSREEFAKLGGYYLGGELVAWLLETHGPAKLLKWMTQTERDDSPSRVQSEYREFFDSELEDDLFEHLREPADISPDEFGCFGPRAPADPDGERFILQAELDCDADDVQNNFKVDGGGYVEWILVIDERQAGRYSLVGEVPMWTALTIEACRCQAPPGAESIVELPHTVRATEAIPAGAYRLRWFGELGQGLELDVALVRG